MACANVRATLTQISRESRPSVTFLDDSTPEGSVPTVADPDEGFQDVDMEDLGDLDEVADDILHKSPSGLVMENGTVLHVPSETYEDELPVELPVAVVSKSVEDQIFESKRRRGFSHRTASAASYKPKTEWPSLYLASACMFMGAVQFSVYLSSMWPFLKEIDSNAKASFFGYIIAAMSLGMLISSPLYGIWVGALKGHCRVPILIGVVIGAVTSFLYCFVQAADQGNRKWFLLVIRFFAGLGAGNASALRSYVAIASALEDRGRAMSMATGAFTLGIVGGPGIQALCTFVGFPGHNIGNVFFVNMYTVPAFITVVVSLLEVVLLLTIFKESSVGLHRPGKSRGKFFILPKFDKLAAFVMVWAWFVLSFLFVSGETIGSPFTMVMFDWTSEQAALYNGIILACSGFVSFWVYIVFGLNYYRKLNERMTIMLGMISMGLFYVITFSWPNLDRPLDWVTDNGTASANSYSNLNTSTISTFVTTGPAVAPVTHAPVGCDPSHYTWCDTTTRIYLSQYLTPYFLLSVGFPLANIVIATLYSKILGPRNQGFMQGVFVGVGSLARTIGPIFVSTMFTEFGPRVPWVINGVLTVITAIIIAITWKRLVALQIRPKLKPGQYVKYKGGRMYRF